jgi:hypothetical protein
LAITVTSEGEREDVYGSPAFNLSHKPERVVFSGSNYTDNPSPRRITFGPAHAQRAIPLAVPFEYPIVNELGVLIKIYYQNLCAAFINGRPDIARQSTGPAVGARKLLPC